MEAYMRRVTDRLKDVWPDGSIAFLGHVGEGNLHIAIGAGGPDDRESVEACVYEPLRPFGGSVSAEHGIGMEKKDWFPISRHRLEEHMFEFKELMRIKYAVF